MREVCFTWTGKIIFHFEIFGITLYPPIDIVLIHFGKSGRVKHVLSLSWNNLPPCISLIAVTRNVYPVAIPEIISQVRGSWICYPV